MANARSRRRSARHHWPAADERLFFLAVEIGLGYADEVGAEGNYAENILWTAVHVGEELYASGEPGNWHAIDGESIGRHAMRCGLAERQTFVDIFVGMIVWLVRTQNMNREVGQRILCACATPLTACSEGQARVARALRQLGGHADLGVRAVS